MTLEQLRHSVEYDSVIEPVIHFWWNRKFDIVSVEPGFFFQTQTQFMI